MDPDSGIVWDGISPGRAARARTATLWTYNQGTVVGAEVELWRLTGDRDPPGPGPADGGRGRSIASPTRRSGAAGPRARGRSVFKGILARYLGDLVIADPEPDGAVASRVRAALTSSGTAVAPAAGATRSDPTGDDRHAAGQPRHRGLGGAAARGAGRTRTTGCRRTDNRQSGTARMNGPFRRFDRVRSEPRTLRSGPPGEPAPAA